MLQLEDICIVRDDREILNISHLEIPTDKFTLVLGHNGSGKSTLAKLLAGQMSADSGHVALNGKATSKYKAAELAKQIAYLPQYLPQAPGLTVKELVKLGRFPWRGILGRWQQQDWQIINSAMQQTNTEYFADTLVDQLSGGERQRAWIAMLLAQQAQLLILDEPTAALDLAHQYELLNLLKQLHTEQGCGVVVVLHDINLALRFASDVLALQHGRVYYQGNVENFAEDKLLSDLFNTQIQLIDHPTQAQQVAVVC